MPTVYCTKKLLNHLDIAPAVPEQRNHSRLGNWYANIVRIERRNAIIYTNERTLFSFLMFKVAAGKPQLFISGFVQGLSLALSLEGYSKDIIETVLEESGPEFLLSRASNQKVMGSMNAIVQDLKHIVWHYGGLSQVPLDGIIHDLNNTPWGAIGYRFPSELVAELLNRDSALNA